MENETETKKDKVLEILNRANDDCATFLCDFIKDGYKDMLAKLLVYIGKEKAQKTLSELPADLSEEISKRAEKLKDAKPSDANIAVEGIFRLRHFDEKKLKNYADELKDESFSDSKIRQKCDNFFEKNPFLSIKLKGLLFTFDDITLLDNRSVQRVLREIDRNDLVKALSYTTDEVKAKILRNMSHRAADMLKEDLEFSGSFHALDVSEAQKEIVNTVLSLADDGLVNIFERDYYIKATSIN